jgi:hypothetical protein
MKSASWLRPLLALALALSSSCTSRRVDVSQQAERLPAPSPVRVTWLAEDRLQLDFEPLLPDPTLELLSEEEARTVLATFLHSLPEDSQLQVLPTRASSQGAPAPWELRLRSEFLARYGPPRLPLPDSLQRSPLFMALKLSPRYMGRGVRDAARELFRSPVFLASIALSILVYFSA